MTKLCIAQNAMNEIEKVGFSPLRAITICERMDGIPNFHHGNLIRKYLFEDGSELEIRQNGCTVIDPTEVTEESWDALSMFPQSEDAK